MWSKNYTEREREKERNAVKTKICAHLRRKEKAQDCVESIRVDCWIISERILRDILGEMNQEGVVVYLGEDRYKLVK